MGYFYQYILICIFAVSFQMLNYLSCCIQTGIIVSNTGKIVLKEL